MVSVMMKTTTLLANLMVEIVVIMMGQIGIGTAVNVSAMFHHLHLALIVGLKMVIVMMKTITLRVDLMAEIAVHLMHTALGIIIAMIV